MIKTFKGFIWAFIFLGIASSSHGQQGHSHAFLEQNLLDRLEGAGTAADIPVWLLLEDAVDVTSLKVRMIEQQTPVNERPRIVMRALKEKANATQPEILEFINRGGQPYSNLKQFWISNSIALTTNAALIEALANLPGVAYMALDAPVVGLIVPEKGEAHTQKSEGGIEPGLAVIGAREMWAMGYAGNGRMAMTFDTGVWPTHPALSARFLPNLMPLSSTWFAYDSPVPVDKTSSHGTHVSGTMLGLNPATADTIGVAPAAYLIATDPVVSNLADVKPLTDFMYGYEWSLNPDGDEETSYDVPDVINNSWGFGPTLNEAPCPPFVVPVFNAVEAAGIANVFSAGNEGPEPLTMSVPHNTNTGLVNTFTVGAINGNASGPSYSIANFSSRGPSICGGEGSLLIKPEVCAPGVNVRSSIGTGGYDNYSGTSMAAPHVSGAVLLLKEAFPYLSGEELLLALYYSAIDQGPPGEDNSYGMGLINVKLAYDYLSATHTPVPAATPEFDLAIVSIDHPTSTLRCSQPGNAVVEPVVTIVNKGTAPAQSPVLRYAINGGAQMVYEALDISLLPGASTQLVLPAIALPEAGPAELHVRIDPLPGEFDPFNNNAVMRWTQLEWADSPNDLFPETFNSGLDQWAVLNPDVDITWDTAYVVQRDGTMGHAAWVNHPDYTYIGNQRDRLVSPTVPITGNSIDVQFDYYYRKRSNSNVQQDTLVVSAVFNCGEMETELFRKGGAQLWTVDVNQANAFPQSGEEWLNVELTIDASLPEIDVAQGVSLAFTSVNRRGNNLLVDNVNFGIASSVRKEIPMLAMNLYPNPATGQVAVSWMPATVGVELSIFDLHGRRVAGYLNLASGAGIDVSSLSPGVYLVALTATDGRRRGTSKLVVH